MCPWTIYLLFHLFLILNTHSYSWPFLSFGVVFEEMWYGWPCPLSIILSIFFVLLALFQAYDWIVMKE